MAARTLVKDSEYELETLIAVSFGSGKLTTPSSCSSLGAVNDTEHVFALVHNILQKVVIVFPMDNVYHKGIHANLPGNISFVPFLIPSIPLTVFHLVLSSYLLIFITFGPTNMPFQEPIAIIGSACRFAGSSTTPSKLWSLLRDPVSLQREIPTSRFNASAFYKSDGTHHGAMNVLHSYLLDQDPRVFDAEFFAINPLEARAMDPQQRMLLEVVYETLESAGLSMDKLKGSDTAVFAGLMCGDYEAMLLRDLDQAPTYFAVGTSRAVLSNRISYFFDWHGASVTVDTACSSSLVSVQQAVQALRNGDSHMAVACGSNLILGPEMYIIESKLKMLSPDGLSRMWDKDANGYARGEGVAAMALKTLSQALADGDNIQAIIREAGVNQDGATSGLTMPSASAQRELIHTVYRKAGLDPTKPEDQPQYIEAHGTGTPAGG